LSFYTLGQRKGLGIGGLRENADQPGSSLHAPWFVARKDMATNTLHVVQGHDHPWLLSSALEAGDLSWVSGSAPKPMRAAAKTRYRQADASCDLDIDGQGEGGDELRLQFHRPQWAVTPGQSAVVYDGDVCLGGGVIRAAR
jgi:tRNA-specific 2-thiouridylase